jgi:diguanylate cyclase (GGDEF)-like protein
MQEQLLPRVYAAERLVDNQNRLLAQCQELVEVNRDLQRLCTIDPLTGLGNRTYGLEKIGSTLRHTESRGGATSLLLLKIHNFDTIQRQLQSHVFEELIVGVSRRLRALMRPLDTVTRFNDKTFMIITHQSDISLASASSFKRIQEGINLRAFKTSTGFHSLQVSISILCCSSEFGIPDANMLIQRCQEGLDEAKATGRIAMNYYREI